MISSCCKPVTCGQRLRTSGQTEPVLTHRRLIREARRELHCDSICAPSKSPKRTRRLVAS